MRVSDLKELAAERSWAGRAGTVSAGELVNGLMDFWQEHDSILRVVDLAAAEGDKRFTRHRMRVLDAVPEFAHHLPEFFLQDVPIDTLHGAFSLAGFDESDQGGDDLVNVAPARLQEELHEIHGGAVFHFGPIAAADQGAFAEHLGHADGGIAQPLAEFTLFFDLAALTLITIGLYAWLW